MATEDKLMGLITGPEESKTYQWRSVEIEATMTIRPQVFLEQLVVNFGRSVTPVFLIKWQDNLTLNNLHWLLEIFPYKRAAENRMRVNHALPCALENGRVQIPFHRKNRLLKISV